MFMDPPMKILTKNDGIVSLMHCQEGNFIYTVMPKSDAFLKFSRNSAGIRA